MASKKYERVYGTINVRLVPSKSKGLGPIYGQLVFINIGNQPMTADGYDEAKSHLLEVIAIELDAITDEAWS